MGFLCIYSMYCSELVEAIGTFFLSLVDTAFCHGKFDGFYDDPNDCQAFYQCLKGRPTKRFCLKGMLFNPMLKTCDTPHNFPCRLTEEVGTVALETESPAVNHDHRPLERNDEGQNLTHSTSGTEQFFWGGERGGVEGGC